MIATKWDIITGICLGVFLNAYWFWHVMTDLKRIEAKVDGLVQLLTAPKEN